jgi:hypothetical protein
LNPKHEPTQLEKIMSAAKRSIAIAHTTRGKQFRPTAPTIERVDGSHISIKWYRDDPVDWAIQVQASPDGEWDFETAVPGSQRSATGFGTPYAVRIVGRDAEHNPVTDVSSVLVLNDLPDKHIVLSYDSGEDELSWTFDGANPAKWEIVNSTDGGLTYPNVEFLDGAATNDAPEYDSGQWKMRQANSDDSPASAWSNVAIKS